MVISRPPWAPQGSFCRRPASVGAVLDVADLRAEQHVAHLAVPNVPFRPVHVVHDLGRVIPVVDVGNPLVGQVVEKVAHATGEDMVATIGAQVLAASRPLKSSWARGPGRAGRHTRRRRARRPNRATCWCRRRPIRPRSVRPCGALEGHKLPADDGRVAGVAGVVAPAAVGRVLGVEDKVHCRLRRAPTSRSPVMP